MSSIYLNSVRFLWVIGATFIVLQDKIEFHKKLSSWGHQSFDPIAVWATHLGDGLFIVFMTLVFLFVRIKTALILLLSFLISSGITQLLKRTLFSDFKRPYYYFKNDDSFRIIADFTYHTEHSFPSGHATSCFVLFTIMAFHYQKKYILQLLFILTAVFISYTRVYLSQHFLQDIIAGSIIGVLVSQFLWQLLNPKFPKLDHPVRISRKRT